MTISGDADGTIWAGTYGDGLYRYKDGTFTHYSTANGLFDDIVFQIVDDRQGSLWMTCNRGVFRVSKQMLDDLAEGRAASDHVGVVRRSDGMRAAECNGNAQPAGIRAHDGTLWFPTIKGVVSVRPGQAGRERAAAAGRHRGAGGRSPAGRPDRRHPPRRPGHGELEFHYTALSFVAPAACDSSIGSSASTVTGSTPATAGKRTTPTFRPGRTTSRSSRRTTTASGIEQGATVSLRLEPHFYETSAVLRGASSSRSRSAISGLFRLRVRRIRARRLEPCSRTHACLARRVATRGRSREESSASAERAERCAAPRRRTKPSSRTAPRVSSSRT